MEYKNNHYVPQFILNKFGDHISLYNVRNFKFEKNRNCRNIFSSNNLYSTEIEKKFNLKIERPFSDILVSKILKENSECILSRDELLIIKKFLLLAQMRTYQGEYFEQSIEEEKFLTKMYAGLGDLLPFKEKEIPNETYRERWLRTLNVVLESDDIRNISQNPDCTAEAYRWANIYNSGYLGIWDSAQSGEDFIITDVGMTSERDLQMKKLHYLIKQILSFPNLAKFYSPILLAVKEFHESFYLFSISKSRMIVLINPFFRLYDKKDNKFLPAPDFWPTEIINRRLFDKNKVEYFIPCSNKIIEHKNDKYKYKIRNLTVRDTIYINMLMLDCVYEFVGFSDINKVRRSINTYIEYPNVLKNYKPLYEIIEEKF